MECELRHRFKLEAQCTKIMAKCVDCGVEIRGDEIVECQVCRAPLCRECGITGLCSGCTELWESEMDLEDVESEEE